MSESGRELKPEIQRLGLVNRTQIEDERLASINRELVEAKAEVQRLRDILEDAGIPYQKQRGLFQGTLRK